MLLTQCASGQNWRKKGGDIVLKLWHQLVFWEVDPIKALTFPFAFDIDSPDAEIDWSFYAYDSGILLDRLRLNNFKFSDCSANLEPVREWTLNQITKLRSHIIDI